MFDDVDDIFRAHVVVNERHSIGAQFPHHIAARQRKAVTSKLPESDSARRIIMSLQMMAGQRCLVRIVAHFAIRLGCVIVFGVALATILSLSPMNVVGFNAKIAIRPRLPNLAKKFAGNRH